VARLELNDLLDQLIYRAGDVMSAQDRLRVLLRGTRAVAAGLDLPTVLRRIVESARDLVDARFAALGVTGPDGGLAEFVHLGVDPGTAETIGEPPRGHGVLGLPLVQDRPVRLADVTAHPAGLGFPPGHPPMQTFLGVPIRGRDHVSGTLYLTDKRDGTPFTAEDEDLVVALAASAAVAVENARLYARETRRNRWQEASNRLSTALLSGAAPEEALDLAAAEVADVLDADGVEVFDGDPPAGSVGRNVLAEARVLVVPLAGPGGAQGWLRAVRRAGLAPFSAEEREAASAFAEQAALALELARARVGAERARVLEERERIARDMHDHVIGRLLGAGLSVQSLSRWVEDPEGQHRLAEHVDEIDGVVRDIRTVIHALSHGEPGAWSLRTRIRQVAAECSTYLGFDPAIQVEESLDLPECSPVADHLLAVLREALTNTARHARASRVEIDVRRGGPGCRRLQLRVHDDGAGPPRQPLPAPRRDGGHGLVNMAHRAATLGGTSALTGAPGRGSILLWEVPFPADG
jgi:signal transduction histidine kinase